jgi:hypothetical protein
VRCMWHRTFVRTETEKLGKIIKAAGISPD